MEGFGLGLGYKGQRWRGLAADRLTICDRPDISEEITGSKVSCGSPVTAKTAAISDTYTKGVPVIYQLVGIFCLKMYSSTLPSFDGSLFTPLFL